MAYKERANKRQVNIFGVKFKFRELFNGLVGDMRLPTLIYLAMASCRLPRPLGVIFVGSSSSGKSFLVKYIAHLFPEAWLEIVSKVSPAVMSKYPPDYYKNRILLFDESAGKSEESSYILRILQSEGKYTYDVTSPTRQAKKETISGPVTLIETTSDDISEHREDNLNRVIVVSPDQSKTHTEEILKFQARVASGVDFSPNPDLVKHHREFQMELKNYKIIIPYSEYIIPRTRHLNARRDFPKILDLLSAIVHLRQNDKPKKINNCDEEYIEAELSDYVILYPLLLIAFKFTTNSSNRICEYYDKIKDNLLKKNTIHFCRKDIESWIGYSQTKSKEILRELQDWDAVIAVKPSRSNQPAVYALSEKRPQLNEPFVTPKELADICGQNDNDCKKSSLFD